MAFALLHNLYLWVRAKTERRLCLAVLGVDGAGKTTLLHTVQGNLVRGCALLKDQLHTEKLARMLEGSSWPAHSARRTRR